MLARPSLSALTVSVLFILLLSLIGCSGVPKGVEAKYPTGENRETSENPYQKPQSVFGGGLNLFGNGKKTEDGSGGGSGIGVNSYLWRASLDTISFMPVATADPFGGTILTDWYSPPQNGSDRFKVNIFILDRQLRSDGVQVKVFKQSFKGGAWHQVAVPPDMARQLEDTILTRARQMRVAQLRSAGK